MIIKEEKVKQIENFSERIFRGKLAKLRKLSDKSNHDLTNVTRNVWLSLFFFLSSLVIVITCPTYLN